MPRRTHECAAAVRSLSVEPTEALAAWLAAQAAHQTVRWLLAHGDDGVTWGRLDDGVLRTGDQVDTTVPALDWQTLWTARLFGETAELLLWRQDEGWGARWIVEAAADPCWPLAFDEAQILWGDTCTSLEHAFTRLTDGAQGLAHTVPLAVRERGQQVRPVRLDVRHYLAPDEQDAWRIVASRLVNLREMGHV